MHVNCRNNYNASVLNRFCNFLFIYSHFMTIQELFPIYRWYSKWGCDVTYYIFFDQPTTVIDTTTFLKVLWVNVDFLCMGLKRP